MRNGPVGAEHIGKEGDRPKSVRKRKIFRTQSNAKHQNRKSGPWRTEFATLPDFQKPDCERTLVQAEDWAVGYGHTSG